MDDRFQCIFAASFGMKLLARRVREDFFVFHIANPGADFAAQPYYVAITPVIHYCMGGFRK